MDVRVTVTASFEMDGYDFSQDREYMQRLFETIAKSFAVDAEVSIITSPPAAFVAAKMDKTEPENGPAVFDEPPAVSTGPRVFEVYEVSPKPRTMLTQSTPQKMTLHELVSLLGCSASEVDEAADLDVGERMTIVGESHDEYTTTRIR